MIKILISAGLAILLMVGISTPAYGLGLPAHSQLVLAEVAEADFTSQEITNFANAYRSIRGIKQDAEAEMVEAVEAEGLSVEEFNTIVDNQINADTGTFDNVTDEQTAQFEAAVESIIAIRQAAEVEMQSVIENEGISVDTFNQIIDQAAQDTDLQQQISERLNQ